MPHITETIITSKDAANTPHAAPFGVRRSGDRLEFSPFRPSKTLENLESHNKAVVHYTDDPLLFAGCLAAKREKFRYAPLGDDGFVLRGTCGWSLVEVLARSADSARPTLTCRVLRENLIAKPFGGFNRAFGGIIEACVVLSRSHILPAVEVERALENAKVLVDKTADERHRRAFLLLRRFYEDRDGKRRR